MTAVPVPALVAAITDELAKHVEMPSGFCLCQAWDAPLLNDHRAHLAEWVAAAVVGLLPGLPPEDLAALIGGAVIGRRPGDPARRVLPIETARRIFPHQALELSVTTPWVPVSQPAPAEPERGA